MPADEPEQSVAPAERALTPEDWETIIAEAKEASPISGSLVGQNLFISDDDGLVVIGIHPDDIDTRDTLLGESFGQIINDKARERCGRNITLRIVSDSSVAAPIPVEIIAPPKFEEIAPAPVPKPAAPPNPLRRRRLRRRHPSNRRRRSSTMTRSLNWLSKRFHATLIKN